MFLIGAIKPIVEKNHNLFYFLREYLGEVSWERTKKNITLHKIKVKIIKIIYTYKINKNVSTKIWRKWTKYEAKSIDNGIFLVFRLFISNVGMMADNP